MCVFVIGQPIENKHLWHSCFFDAAIVDSTKKKIGVGFLSTRDYQPGQELFDSYESEHDVKCNLVLLYQFGFTLPSPDARDCVITSFGMASCLNAAQRMWLFPSCRHQAPERRYWRIRKTSDVSSWHPTRKVCPLSKVNNLLLLSFDHDHRGESRWINIFWSWLGLSYWKRRI